MDCSMHDADEACNCKRVNVLETCLTPAKTSARDKAISFGWKGTQPNSNGLLKGLHSVWVPYCEQQKPCLRPSSVQWNPVCGQTMAPPGQPAQDFKDLQGTNIGRVDANALGSALLLGLVSLEIAPGTPQQLLIPRTIVRLGRHRC